MIYKFHEKDGVNFSCPIKIDPLSEVTTFMGGTADVGLLIGDIIQDYAGVATPFSDTLIKCVFAPYLVPPGTYKLQVGATPIGFTYRTVADVIIQVLKSAQAAPGP